MRQSLQQLSLTRRACQLRLEVLIRGQCPVSDLRRRLDRAAGSDQFRQGRGKCVADRMLVVVARPQQGLKEFG